MRPIKAAKLAMAEAPEPHNEGIDATSLDFLLEDERDLVQMAMDPILTSHENDFDTELGDLLNLSIGDNDQLDSDLNTAEVVVVTQAEHEREMSGH